MNSKNEEFKMIASKIMEVESSTKFMTRVSKLCKNITDTEEYNYCFKRNLEGLKYLIKEYSQ